MIDLAQQQVSGELHDSKFMSAAEKRKVLKQWEKFLESGCARERFTKPLYTHLIMHCSFIAHYSIHGFYETYFLEGDATVHFLSQFDDSQGTPRSVEYGMTYWINDEEYSDINSRMVRIAGKYMPVLMPRFKNRQRHADIGRARALLAKHGIELDDDEVEENTSLAERG